MNPITTLVDFRYSKLGKTPPNIKIANDILKVLLGVSKPVAIIITIYLFILRILFLLTPSTKTNSLINALSKMPGTSILNKLVFSFIDLAIDSKPGTK